MVKGCSLTVKSLSRYRRMNLVNLAAVCDLFEQEMFDLRGTGFTPSVEGP